MRKLLAILTVALCCTGTVLAQEQYVPAPVTVSKEKVKFGDKVYWSHVVLERQTLYSICKAYNVSLQEVYDANPDLRLETEGLKKNSILRIPIHETAAPVADVPAKAAAAAPQAEVKPRSQEAVTVHTVKWFEDLDGIAAKYKVSKEAIMQANNLTSEKLSPRTKLLIPIAGGSEAKAEVPVVEASQESAQSFDAAPQPAEQEAPAFKQDLNFALILPFNAGSNTKSSYMDFYCGALLAARDAKEHGVNVRLKVYDETKDINAVDSTEFAGMDAVLGPILPETMGKVLPVISRKVTVVSPLDAKTGLLTRDYGNLVHTNPSASNQWADVADWVASDKTASDAVLIISQKGKGAIAGQLNEMFSQKGIHTAVFEYDILNGRNVGGALGSKMTNSGCNRVIIASESEAFVIDATRNLMTLVSSNQLKVTLYGNSRYKRFETISVETLHELNLHMSTSTDVNYDDEKVQAFLDAYREFFQTEPKEHAFCGYDLVAYFAEVMSQYNDQWRDYVGGKRIEMLQSSFMFEKESEASGLTNCTVRRVEYTPDYRIVSVR